MNKGKLYSLIAMVFLLAMVGAKYLFTGSALPDVKTWEQGADTLIIEREGRAVTLQKQGELWHIKEGGYRAADATVERMVGKIKDMKLYDLVTKDKKYSRYDLEDRKAVHIVVKSGDKILQDLFIGKQSPGVSQSYLRLSGDDAVYLAGSFSSRDFISDVEALRNKELVKVSPEVVELVSISYNGETVSFHPQDETTEDDEGKQSTDRIWKLDDGTTLDKSKVSGLVSQLNPFRADGFTDVDFDFSSPLVSIRIQAYGKEVVLDIIEKDDETCILRSSETGELYTANRSSCEKFMVGKADLL